MKKIYIFTAVLALLTLSLNAQFQAKKNVAKQATATEKKVEKPNFGIQKAASNLTGNRTPSRAPMRADRATQTWSWSYGNALPSDWSFGDPTNTGWGDNGDGTYYIGVSDANVQPSEFSIHIPASVFTGYTNNVQVVISAKADAGYNSQTISVNGDSKSITTSLNTYTWTNVDVTNGIVINPTDSYTGLASITITGNSESGGNTDAVTICDGTNTNSYLPVYGLYVDNNYQVNQMIYPASELTGLVGKTITSMTFYTNSPIGSNLGGSTWTVKLGTTTQATFAYSLSNITRLEPSNVVAVAQGIHLPTGGTTMTITFSTPFTYAGNNLLVDFEETAYTSNYASTSFYGVNQPTGSYTGYNSYGTSMSNGHYGTGYGRNFLPKVTFTYEKEDQHDLAIALSAPATAGAGSTVDVTATVTNNGDFAENGYTVTVSDGTNIVNITAQEELGIGETATFTVQFATSANAAGSTVNYTATVACTDDAVTGNNTATASTALINLPPPINVAATAGNNHNATMTWSAPVDPLPFTESFENGANGWTFIDNDGDGYNWTWSNTLSANTGTGLVYSESYHNTSSSGGVALTPDNWLISPEAILNGTFSLYAKGQDANYPAEVFGVYVCVGDYNANNLSNFQQVGSDITTTASMVQYPFDLSSFNGQIGHIAIVHHNVTDKFILNVDDITFLTPPQPTSYNIYLDGVLIVNVPSTTFSYDFSNLADGEHTCAVSAVYSYGESVAVPATFTITSLPTPNAPTVNSTNGTTSTTITITPDPVTDGNLVYYVEYNGQQTQDLTFPRGATEYVVYVHAHTTATANYNESPEAVVPVTIPALPQTEAPVISYETVGDNVVITATGNGTVTLNIPGYPEATGTGSASITVPRHMEDYTVTATATAQEADHLVSEATTEQVPISGLVNDGDWLQMDGSYTTGDQQLTFTRGNNPILFVDQFTAETHKNEHPDHYNYCLSEDVENDAKTSSTIPIPVHKTYSTLQGLYTKAEVDNDALDTPREITANAVNGTMAYDIKAGSEVYFYGLYRGALDANPVIDDSHRISMIQKDLNEAFFNENMTNDVEPKYSHIGAGDIKRVDKDFVTGNNSNTMAYVPVIWTYGDHTGRPAATGNNSYGSDIKRMKIGDVTARIEGTKSDGNSWGKWKVGETEYCVYTPVISITGIMPVDIPQGDGDYATYEPYMFRAWCTYDKAYDFGHDADGHLVGGDLIPAPFLLDSVLLEPNQKEYVLGGDWNGETRMPWAFGVEVGESATNITFLIRFYYKKVVTDAQQSSKLMGNRDGEDAEEYFAVQCEGDAQGIVTAINEILNGRIPIETTYVNAQGMTSNKPFDGLNIVVTRYSDGSTTTTKVVR